MGFFHHTSSPPTLTHSTTPQSKPALLLCHTQHTKIPNQWTPHRHAVSVCLLPDQTPSCVNPYAFMFVLYKPSFFLGGWRCWYSQTPTAKQPHTKNSQCQTWGTRRGPTKCSGNKTTPKHQAPPHNIYTSLKCCKYNMNTYQHCNTSAINVHLGSDR